MTDPREPCVGNPTFALFRFDAIIFGYTNVRRLFRTSGIKAVERLAPLYVIGRADRHCDWCIRNANESVM